MKKHDCKTNYFFIGLPSVDFWQLLVNRVYLINNFITSTISGPKKQHKQGIQLCFGGNLTKRNTLQFQYFLDFNECLWVIFSQLSFWLYLLGEVAMTQKLLKMTQKNFKSPYSGSSWINSLS